jgi:hypothetical protein
VTVYYESMCPDSKYFIRHQLVPTVEKISEILDFKLIPYGKAKVLLFSFLGIDLQNYIFNFFHFIARLLRIPLVYSSLVNTENLNVLETKSMHVESNTLKIKQNF